MPPTPSIKVGDIFTNNQGCKGEVIEYINARKVKIKFLDKLGCEKYFEVSDIKKGTFSNPYFPNTLGRGFIGEGEYSSKSDGKTSVEYNIWSAMMVRSYDPNYHEKFPTYIGCSVSKYFLNYQNCAKWLNEQPNFGRKGFVLDKDLLVRGNKTYSPETCCIIPQEINSFLAVRPSSNPDLPVGVTISRYGKYLAKFSKTPLGSFKTLDRAFRAYKEAKEYKAKQLATTYKDQIDIRAYEALMKYEVNIDD